MRYGDVKLLPKPSFVTSFHKIVFVDNNAVGRLNFYFIYLLKGALLLKH